MGTELKGQETTRSPFALPPRQTGLVKGGRSACLSVHAFITSITHKYSNDILQVVQYGTK